MRSYWYKRLPITYKLRLLVMVGGLLFIFCFGAIYIYYGAHLLKQNFINNTVDNTKLIGSRSQASIVFANPEFANKNLENLNLDDSYKLICLYDGKGTLFSSHGNYQETCPIEKRLNSGMFKEYVTTENNNIVVLRNIIGNSEIIGAILVKRSENEVHEYVCNQLKTMLIIMILSALVGYPITNYLQQFISKPMMEMTKNIQTIAIEPNAEQRISRQFDDELGKVAEAFNHILTAMQKRQTELLKHNEHLTGSLSIITERMDVMMNEHLESVESFSTYADLINQRILGSELDSYIPYQEDVASSLAVYTSNFDTFLQITKNYALAVTGIRTPINFTEEMLAFAKKLRLGAPVDVLNNINSHTHQELAVFKLAWVETFKVLRSLFTVLSTLVDFPPNLSLDLHDGPLRATISLFDQNSTLQMSRPSLIHSLFPSLNDEKRVFWGDNLYRNNTIEDPNVAEEFLSEEFPRADMQFLLDNIAYIANANSIGFDHLFQPGKFMIMLDFSKVVHVEINELEAQMVLQ